MFQFCEITRGRIVSQLWITLIVASYSELSMMIDEPGLQSIFETPL